MTVEFDQDLQLFRVILKGRIDGRATLQALEAMFAHPEFTPGVPAIWDANDADLSSLTQETFADFRRYQLARAKIRGRARLAFVSASDLAFGLGRMFEQSADLPHLEMRVFRDTRSAEDWILARRTKV